MKANPGGHIAPSDVLGRDEFIQRLWRILERQSLTLTAVRRMGKTCISGKMVAEAPPQVLPIYRDLERVRTPLEFSEIVFNDVEGYLSTLLRTAERARQWLAHVTGLEIRGLIKLPDAVAPHWKTLLIKTIEDLVENQDRTVILFWDEMPLMLYNIKQREGEEKAMEVLDTLRSLRQMNPGLRMIFTGSIGLHNVITSLKQAGYANDPTNDMYQQDVPPLSLSDAQELARRLLEGEEIAPEDPQATALAIATSADGIPFYIHHIVDQMVQRPRPIRVTTVREILDAFLTDPHDPWHLGYFRERIDTYYTPDERPFALGLLDILSAAGEPLAFENIFNLLKARLVTEDSEMTRHVVTLLQRDHYVLQQTDGAFRFRFSLIKCWWQLHRGMGS